MEDREQWRAAVRNSWGDITVYIATCPESERVRASYRWQLLLDKTFPCLVYVCLASFYVTFWFLDSARQWCFSLSAKQQKYIYEVWKLVNQQKSYSMIFDVMAILVNYAIKFLSASVTHFILYQLSTIKLMITVMYIVVGGQFFCYKGLVI